MENKEIQEQRMRGYFIQATKEMLKGEGLKSLSVRKISDRAGYSYATMYNYFRDVQELIFLCVKDFQDECREMVESGTTTLSPGKERISEKATAYIRYFIEYPGIFELFYLEKMTDIELKQPVSALIYTFLTRLCQPDWDYCVNHGIYDETEANARQTELNYMVTGMLLYYLNRRQPVAYDEFLKISTAQVARILR
jgi:AcrR family transcriptional regulator